MPQQTIWWDMPSCFSSWWVIIYLFYNNRMWCIHQHCTNVMYQIYVVLCGYPGTVNVLYKHIKGGREEQFIDSYIWHSVPVIWLSCSIRRKYWYAKLMGTKWAFVHSSALLTDHKALDVLNVIILSFDFQQSENCTDCAGGVPQKYHSWKNPASTES